MPRPAAPAPDKSYRPTTFADPANTCHEKGCWRISTRTVLDSHFLIAQDLLSLDGFAVQRLVWGVNLSKSRDRLVLTFAVENLTNKYFRGHFQFAPPAAGASPSA